MGQELINTENIEIQQMLENYLRFRTSVPSDGGTHLDDDSLAAFVEGDLSARENNMFMGHISDCGFCLHKTAEIAELQAHFESEEMGSAIVSESQPVKISEVLSGLFSRLFGSFESEQTVFAHEEKKEDDQAKEDSGEQSEKPKE
jgi:hypothetical protein